MQTQILEFTVTTLSLIVRVQLMSHVSLCNSSSLHPPFKEEQLSLPAGLATL